MTDLQTLFIQLSDKTIIRAAHIDYIEKIEGGSLVFFNSGNQKFVPNKSPDEILRKIGEFGVLIYASPETQ